MTFGHLEELGGFSYPQLYRRLAADGRLDYAASGSPQDLRSLLERPPFLAFAYDYQGYGGAEAAEVFAELRDPEGFWGLSSTDLFVPIGRTESGDHYCLDLADGDGAVVLLWHDSDEIETLAPDLASFGFTLLLSSACHLDDDLLARSTETLHAMWTADLPYLDERQAEVLRAVWDGGTLDEARVEAIVAEVVGIHPAERPIRSRG